MRQNIIGEIEQPMYFQIDSDFNCKLRFIFMIFLIILKDITRKRRIQGRHIICTSILPNYPSKGFHICLREWVPPKCIFV